MGKTGEEGDEIREGKGMNEGDKRKTEGRKREGGGLRNKSKGKFMNGINSENQIRRNIRIRREGGGNKEQITIYRWNWITSVS